MHLKTDDGMIQLQVPHPGRVLLKFDVDATNALSALAGRAAEVCAKSN